MPLGNIESLVGWFMVVADCSVDTVDVCCDVDSFALLGVIWSACVPFVVAALMAGPNGCCVRIQLGWLVAHDIIIDARIAPNTMPISWTAWNQRASRRTRSFRLHGILWSSAVLLSLIICTVVGHSCWPQLIRLANNTTKLNLHIQLGPSVSPSKKYAGTSSQMAGYKCTSKNMLKAT